MKKLALIIALMGLGACVMAQDLKYYLPDSVSYNPAIPKPKDIVYHEVGEYHITHDRLVNYMKAVATAAPDRIKLELMGLTYEKRPQVLLVITSPKNHQRLEEIRQQHVQLTDPARSGSLNIENMPIVVWIGHSIHGNEQSGTNASLVTAYYLAAAQGRQIDELLENTVILFDPSFNPDGMQRFSGWVNQHRSKNLVSDPNDREFNEVWPGGRFNHYWFDLNRDWLPAIHVESQNRLEWFHKWKPNILTDHHEQGSNATFFFQPGVPSRVNPITPDKNQELTGKLGKYHAAFLDRIGSLYFTKENYDDFYYGKGSTYPDVNGAIGILFEQASSRGHLQQTSNGLLSFPFTIRNQFVTALSTLEGAKALRKEFLQWQRDFYRSAMTESAGVAVKGYVFGDEQDKAKTFHFAEMLRRHQIEVLSVKNKFSAEGSEFKPGSSYVVPTNQPQYRLIRAIFEKTFTYKDSLFYDITSWTMPLAFGLPSAELSAAQYGPAAGDKITDLPKQVGELTGKSEYAYLFTWDELYAPRALYELQQAGVTVKVATNKFEIPVSGSNVSFDYGTIMIPVKQQRLGSAQLAEVLKGVADRNYIRIWAVNSGNVNSGSDLGSSKFAPVAEPRVAMLAGAGVNATDAGEVWHLLDQRMNIPATHLEPSAFNRVEVDKYNTLIMVGGSYNELNKEKLKSWVQAGGVLILTEEAVQWAAQNGISNVSFKKTKAPVDSSQKAVYVDREQVDGAQRMSGAIFGAEADLTHPLAYGYNQKTVSLFKANRVFMEKSKNPYATPFFYGAKPMQSGWVSRENLDAVKNSAAVVVNTVGGGRVISIADNPNFRAFWLGGSKLFMNAIFFGRVIDAASGRGE
ncbi:M14 family metallopeptidase [Terrimonas sp. NA20]|uniref:M14 family metallopeptidase n=1 Tax=Terrimonas ginsenosidimutans TaxID=2908004 RepID=A0ABS9KUD3_9BACT|nr:M14 metallopeptidase family protein [Terrimonas ginsenosidimutans]MCG2615898.1 M14 family metallopeptidase [Terrimonas ginsenosidimutans]